jgi:hypothetical protein
MASERAPQGTKPGGYVMHTVKEFATVKALDRQAREATLQFADGQSQTIHVGDNVDLTAVKPGDKVAIRHTEGAAIDVEAK